MTTDTNERAYKLMREINLIDPETLELKKEFQYKRCPFCEVDDGEIINTYLTKEALFYKFKKCNRCSLIYTYPRPNRDIVEGEFKAPRFSQSTERRYKVVSDRKELEKKDHFWRKILRALWRKTAFLYSFQEFKKYARKGYKVLDVGAGTGGLARELIKKGCVVEAVELNPYRAKCLRDTLGIKVYEGPFKDADITESGYDMVVFSQVLMHLFSIKDTIEKLKYALRPGGLLAASLTNFNSVAQRTIRSPFPGKGPTPAEVFSWFTPDSMSKILKMSDFKVIDVIYRPKGLLEFLFVDGYPGGRINKFILKIMDQIITMMLIRTGSTDYFSIVAKKPDTIIPVSRNRE